MKQRKITTNPTLTTNSLQDGVSDAKLWKRTVDVTGLPKTDHPLTITERDNRGWTPLTGYEDQGNGSFREYSNWIVSGFTNVSHESISIPSVGERATTLRARTNPSREEVSIPNFLYEMKDLPHMIRQMKNLGPLIRNLRHRNHAAMSAVASQYLGYEFGWKPLISDISQLLQFQSQVDRRILELNRLYSGTGLKRRLNLFDGTETSSSNATVETSLGRFFTVRKDIVTRKRSWGTIRWRPTAVPKDIGHQALGKQARRLVHGIDHYGVDATQAWNAIPFSWLADWFGNFGEWLAAHRNDVPAAPTGPCNIMTLTETYELWTRTDSATQMFKGADGLRVLRTKERVQSSGTLSVHLPLATARQFSILAALNLQRKKR
ncbi:TPA_asm: maturation protein [ssRNA phage SRR7976325_29]|uniref:Maturation protein n=1 Tax=ssRNA phage SRR7976325_29 TaxID=2786717 RepID=A0A8S5L5N3_9VIRU|nr:maturation protein [ssRNA phage SRR7976325_29]DAD52767.1 TPA_asm: maturation protein [ssRNA phage SRR7976325_29]